MVTGLVLCSLSDGLIFGQMSGMIHALQDASSSMNLSEDDISAIGEKHYLYDTQKYELRSKTILFVFCHQIKKKIKYKYYLLK